MTVLAMPIVHAQPAGGPLKVTVYQPLKADMSPPLRNTPPLSRPPVRQHRPRFHLVVTGAGAAVVDRTTQISATTLVPASSPSNFEGIAAGAAGPLVTPPDENLAVGPNHIVQTVNVTFAVFNKNTGTMAPGFPKEISSIWSGFGGACEVDPSSDPIVRYDRTADRWVITQITFNTATFFGNFHACMAV
ncbi:MAG TPA: hypothetical protein VFL57_10725, partial [Bryobacteraceae bacterium]|nr:hypothetical protein [Bryobacteraceae bacterium]